MVQKSSKTSGKVVKKSHRIVENPQSQAVSPLISVIIPVYNVKPFLARCLDSVINQTYSHLEIILIDDGSTDGSGELCDQLSQSDTRIRVIHQLNQGLSAARNSGIDSAKGEYLTFVDSDDTISLDMIEILYNLCSEHQTALSMCSFCEVFPNPTQNVDFAEYWKGSHASPVIFSTANCLKSMLLEEGFTVSAWGKLYQRQLFEQIRYPVGCLHEDVGTTYRLILQCPQIAFLPSPKYHYYQNPKSITKQKFCKDKLSLVDFTDEMCEMIDKEYPELKDVTAERRMHARFSILRQTIFVEHPSASTQAIEKSMINYLKAHKNDILKNPYATKRDRIALAALLINKQLFKLGWKVYRHS